VRADQVNRIQRALENAYRWPTPLNPRAPAVLDPATTAALTADPVAIGPLTGPVSVQVTVTVAFQKAGPGGREHPQCQRSPGDCAYRPIQFLAGYCSTSC